MNVKCDVCGSELPSNDGIQGECPGCSAEGGAFRNVTELGNYAPSAESVLSRLWRNMDGIKNVVVFVEYKDKTCDIAYSTMSSSSLTYAAAAVTHKINEIVFEEE